MWSTNTTRMRSDYTCILEIILLTKFSQFDPTDFKPNDPWLSTFSNLTTSDVLWPALKQVSFYTQYDTWTCQMWNQGKSLLLRCWAYKQDIANTHTYTPSWLRFSPKAKCLIQQNNENFKADFDFLLQLAQMFTSITCHQRYNATFRIFRVIYFTWIHTGLSCICKEYQISRLIYVSQTQWVIQRRVALRHLEFSHRWYSKNIRSTSGGAICKGSIC